MNIDEMIAGKELDYLLAERAMGWTEDPEGCWLDRNNKYADTGWGTEHNTHGLPFWQPSTNIAIVDILIDRLHQLGLCITLRDDATALIVWCHIHRAGFGPPAQTYVATARAGMRPLAISRAVLKAVPF